MRRKRACNHANVRRAGVCVCVCVIVAAALRIGLSAPHPNSGRPLNFVCLLLCPLLLLLLCPVSVHVPLPTPPQSPVSPLLSKSGVVAPAPGVSSPSLAVAEASAAVNMPDAEGFFGAYGGQIIPPHLKAAMDDIARAYEEIRQREDFQTELASLYADYVGRPSPIFHAKRLSAQLGGAQIHLKREDLNHTGAHKINHCLGEALLAKFMGKTRVIAETGAGQHGVALATACALVGIPCEVHMGQVDIIKEVRRQTHKNSKSNRLTCSQRMCWPGSSRSFGLETGRPLSGAHRN